jgi:site-specific DNA recombinase
VGEILHKGAIYPGKHEAIIDRAQWNQVQDLLRGNQQGRRRKTRVTKASLFTGMLFDASGNLYTPTHAKKDGRRYRYYTSQAVILKATETDLPARIRAHDLEVAVCDQILEFLKSPKQVLGALAPSGQRSRGGRYSEFLRQASDKVASWARSSPCAKDQFIRAILERVVIRQDEAEISRDLMVTAEGTLLNRTNTQPRTVDDDDRRTIAQNSRHNASIGS